MTVVLEFHVAFDQPRPASPPLLADPDLVRLRMRLISEEFKEVQAELAALALAKDSNRALEVYPRLLKELCDLRYVVEGCAVSLGLPIDAAYAEVHRSNMSKAGGERRADGKILKGPNYTDADMGQFIPSVIDHEED